MELNEFLTRYPNGIPQFDSFMISELQGHRQLPFKFQVVLSGISHPLAKVHLRRRTIDLYQKFIPYILPLDCELIHQLWQHPLFRDFTLDSYIKDDYESGWPETLNDAYQHVRLVTMTAPIWPEGMLAPDDPKEETYAFRIGSLPSDITWYHATRSSNVRSIRQHGLIPSGLREQGKGWTQLNFQLQAGVYLTDSMSYAQAIAETLAQRYDETGIVLEVDGKALTDTSKLLPDEDAFRSHYDGMIDYTAADSRYPAFYSSWASRVSSVVYAGRIPTRYLQIKRGGRFRVDEER
jgi:hypothetical protein